MTDQHAHRRDESRGGRLEIISGYQFRSLDQLALARQRIEAQVSALGLKGTVLIAAEGINFSLTGPGRALDEWLDWLARQMQIDAPVVSRQAVEQPPFLRLKVRVRDEVVTFDTSVQPDAGTEASALSGAEWNRLLERDDVQLVDTRNDYEFRLGSFVGAQNPETGSFAEFKRYSENHLDPERPVAMFCTGGVRCEKAGPWLKSRGFKAVYQLKGGILGYLAETPPEQSLWRGECFVFDDRVSVDSSLTACGRVICRGCREPAEGLDAAGNPPIGAAGGCQLCNKVFDQSMLGSLRERARQVALARARGQSHLGPTAQAGGSDS
ncbi:MAG: rhodanese-like domain-containing protein [Wenzhouxiangellaceae bacterium]|nr:rhodanese-like domain-containing protein [Wenzhouxiangellaceae bacterium]